MCCFKPWDKAKDIGLSNQDGDEAFVQCLDPCKYTSGDTAVFIIKCISIIKYLII